MKNIARFVRTYTVLSVVLDASLIALAFDLLNRDNISHWIILITCTLALAPLLYNMWQDFRHGTYGINILTAIAIVTALVMHEYWAAVIITLTLTGNRALEDYAQRRARSKLNAMHAHAPQKARILKAHNKVIDAQVTNVQVGDKLEIRPGEIVPVDAEILEGKSDFDESGIIGDRSLQTVVQGDTILSGSINNGETVIARAQHTAANSQYQQIIALVEAASHSTAPLSRMAGRGVVPFTILSLFIAGSAWYLSGESIRFLEVLVVATPLSLIMAAPLAIVSGMSLAAKRGIIVKNAATLERLANAKTMAFSKTGTLTEPTLSIETITPFNGYKESEVLSLAASVEQMSGHAVATAITNHALAKKAKITKAKHTTEYLGRGIIGTISGKQIAIGRQKLLEDLGIQVPPSSFKATDTTVFVASGNMLVGTITFRSTLRTKSKPTVQSLKNMGLKKFLLVTSDATKVAQKVANKLGIDNVISDALPSEKLVAMEKISARPLVFVGDGIHDASALMTADVGIALGVRGLINASESADIAVMQNDISEIGTAFKIAKHTSTIAKQSVFVGATLSLVLMAAFATGHFKPIYGAEIQEIVCIVVLFSALRAGASSNKVKTT